MTRAHGLLVGLVVAYLLVAGIYAATIPTFEGFDAQAHFAAIQYFRRAQALPELTPATAAVSYELVPHPPLYYILAALAGSGFPRAEATAAAQASANAYFDKSLALRQSVTLPNLGWQDLAGASAARAVSLLGGLVVLLCTWWTARRLHERTPTFALAAAAIAAFNPQFLFTAVTITNDGWSAGMAALALAAGVEVLLANRPPRAWFWVGAATGLAALTKYSTLAVVLPLGVLYLLYLWAGPLERRTWRTALAALAAAAGGFILVAGWWFVRNWLLYREIVPLDRMAEILPTMRRADPYTWQRTFEHIPWLIASFWGVFVAVIAPPAYLDAARWFMLIGFGGLVFGLLMGAVWWRRTSRLLPHLVIYLVLLPWLGVVAAMVLYWTRTVEYGEQGRLAHVGASAFGLVMAAGWGAWLPAALLPRLRAWQQGLHLLLALAAVGTALALVPFLQANFGIPPSVTLAAPPAAPAQQDARAVTPDRPLRVSFAGGMRLLGVDFPQGAALEAGKPLPLTLYFTADAPIPADYTLFLHVADAQDRLLYQFDGVPAQGRHPTRQWRPGEVFADTHTIVVDEIPRGSSPNDGSEAGGLAFLSLGFYPIADPAARVTVYDGGGQPIGDRLVVAPLRLHAAGADSQPGTLNPPDGEGGDRPGVPGRELPAWENGIVLAAADLAADPQGLPSGIALTWSPTATLHTDYTVFVQVLDAENNILAQADAQPQGGAYPTSTWRAGDVITDTLTWQGDVHAWARVILGLYNAGGERLELVGGGDSLVAAER
jgi:hypothetical protein